ncbi:MAG TPA: helix-turn-helix domain-containing protein [Ureibacillus sp.]|nr:helix-turn-helix domain-containing protein [Ureibacillus sp.]
MENEDKKIHSTVQSLEIGFNVLEVIAESPTPIKFSEIQERSQMTKSNLYKYLNTLTKIGVVSRDPYSGTFHLGMKLLEYNKKFHAQQDITAIVTPFLREISMQTENSVFLMLPTFNGPIISKFYSPGEAITLGGQIGAILPPNTSAGKIFVAFYKDPLNDEWKQKAKETIDPWELKRALEEKIIYSFEPLERNISSIAFPILDGFDELKCIITVVGFNSNIELSSNSTLINYCYDMQRKISAIF